MPTTTPTILDQISAEKTKVSERLIRLDADRAKIATQLRDLETAERVLTRVSKTPPARRRRSASASEAKASNATRGRCQVNLSRSEKPEAGWAIIRPRLHRAIRSPLRPERSAA